MITKHIGNQRRIKGQGYRGHSDDTQLRHYCRHQLWHRWRPTNTHKMPCSCFHLPVAILSEACSHPHIYTHVHTHTHIHLATYNWLLDICKYTICILVFRSVTKNLFIRFRMLWDYTKDTNKQQQCQRQQWDTNGNEVGKKNKHNNSKICTDIRTAM